jgi:DinB family protein
VKPLVEVTEAIAVLERTPPLLDSWLVGLSPEWLDARESEGTWSPLEVVGHLAHNEETDWMTRLEIVLLHGEAQPFEPYEREGFRTRFPGWPLERLLPRFSSARRENLDKLRDLNLRPVDLNRTGMHPALGRVTVRQLLAGWVVHDLTHVAQIARVLAKRYDVAVGPWREYMGVLNERRS